MDKKRKKVDRKFRMTPKNDSQSDTQKAKDDTKNATLTDDLQEVNNDAINTHDTKNDTNKRIKLSVIEANF